MWLGGGNVYATTNVATTTELINAINSGETDIVLAAGDYNLNAPLHINSTITLTGASSDSENPPTTTLNGQGSTRVFYIESGTVNISALIIANGHTDGSSGGDASGAGASGGGGSAGMGGGVFIKDGDVTFTNVVFQNNQAIGGAGGAGGGIDDSVSGAIGGIGGSDGAGGGGNGGSLGGGGGGGAALGGAIFILNGDLNLIDCTIQDNLARGGNGGSASTEDGDAGYGRGGGIYVATGVNSASATNISCKRNKIRQGESGSDFVNNVYPLEGTDIACPFTLGGGDTQLDDDTVELQWEPVDDVVLYMIRIGDNPKGNNYFESGPSSDLRVTATDLPIDGRTIYVTLWGRYNNGSWRIIIIEEFTSVDFISEIIPVKISNPPDGATFNSPGSPITFSLTGGGDETEAAIMRVGSAPGANNIGEVVLDVQPLQEEVTINNMPVDGRLIYIRMWYKAYGKWYTKDFTYQAYLIPTD